MKHLIRILLYVMQTAGFHQALCDHLGSFAAQNLPLSKNNFQDQVGTDAKKKNCKLTGAGRLSRKEVFKRSILLKGCHVIVEL